MHAFDVLGSPVRRRILELLASGEHTSGSLVEVVQQEFGISPTPLRKALATTVDWYAAALSSGGQR